MRKLSVHAYAGNQVTLDISASPSPDYVFDLSRSPRHSDHAYETADSDSALLSARQQNAHINGGHTVSSGNPFEAAPYVVSNDEHARRKRKRAFIEKHANES